MLRMAVLICGSALLVLGAALCAWGLPNPGAQAVLLGAIVVAGVLFERWRYRNEAAAKDGDWQATGERFVDPGTGKDVEVLYDPRTGERRYVPVQESHNRPD